MKAHTRKAVGCLALLGYLGAYLALAAALGAALVPHLPAWAQAAYFIAAGVAWIFPLKPLIAWMNRGG